MKMNLRSILIGAAVAALLFLCMAFTQNHVGGTGTYRMDIDGDTVGIIDTRTGRVRLYSSDRDNIPPVPKSERIIYNFSE